MLEKIYILHVHYVLKFIIEMAQLIRLCTQRFSNILTPRSVRFHTITTQKFPQLKNLLPTQQIFVRPLRNFAQEESRNRTVGKWLLGCSGMVYMAVALGGITRLTESGLSMTSWKLLGEKLPRSQADWEKEFEIYQQFPEYKMKNMNMSLEEFKFIFLMEYIHRMWGRCIGGVFFLPAAFFWKKGYFDSRTKKFIVLLGALLAGQGLMGWYMVQSGLEEERFQDVNDVPRVSQYRLAAHLGTAFVFYTFLLSQALQKLLPPEHLSKSCQGAIQLRRLAMATKGLVFVTAISGAFVAGLDAGLVYNSFPKMGDKWIPDDVLAFKPLQRNFTENPTTVQLDHRVLGISTLTIISALWLLSRRTQLPKRARWAVNAVTAMAWGQATLGITTLLYYVPTSLATAHQSGSLMLLSLAIWLTHELRLVKYIPK